MEDRCSSCDGTQDTGHRRTCSLFVVAFLAEHPEFEDGFGPRLDTGESAFQDPPLDLRLGGQRVQIGSLFEDEGAPVPPNSSRSVRERVLAVRVERLLERIKPEQADLLRRVYWERQPREGIAADLRISHQAVTSRLRTAERAFMRAIAEHGGDVDILNVREEDL